MNQQNIIEFDLFNEYGFVRSDCASSAGRYATVRFTAPHTSTASGTIVLEPTDGGNKVSFSVSECSARIDVCALKDGVYQARMVGRHGNRIYDRDLGSVSVCGERIEFVPPKDTILYLLAAIDRLSSDISDCKKKYTDLYRETHSVQIG